MVYKLCWNVDLPGKSKLKYTALSYMDILMDKLHTVFLYKHNSQSHGFPLKEWIDTCLKTFRKMWRHQCSHMKVISELNEKQTFSQISQMERRGSEGRKTWASHRVSTSFYDGNYLQGGSYRNSIIHTPCQNITSSINKVTVKAKEHNQEMKSIEDNSPQAKSALCKDTNHAQSDGFFSFLHTK